MPQSHRSLISLSLLAALLTLTAVWSPAALAQDTSGQGPATACEASTATITGEVLPTGVVREMLFTTAIDSTAFESEEVPALTAVTSIVCMAANTEVEVEVEGAGNSLKISQFYTTTLVILAGELELKLVEACANPGAGGTCTVTNGEASFRTAADRTTPAAIAADWTPIPAGSIVVLSDVTISIRTTDSAVRVLTTGVAADITGGGACPTGCGRWKFP